MERLTTRLKSGRAILIGNISQVFNPKIGRFYEGKAIDKLAEYEDAEEKGSYVKWIPVSERLPETEVEVLITVRRKYTGGRCVDIITTAIYEDGKTSEFDSCWNWTDIDGEYDEKNDCYIVPEGWWEDRHYNPDEVYNNLVDDEVMAWMPLPEPYRESEE